MKFHGILGIISGTTAAIVDGKLWVNHSIGRLLESLIERSDDAYLCIPIIPQKLPSLNHALNIDLSKVLKLPPLQTTISAQRYYFKVQETIQQIVNLSDALFIRLPFQLPDRILRLKKPKVLHVVSSPLNVIRASTDYQGVMRTAALSFAAFSEFCMKRAARELSTRVCSNGEEMWRRLDPPAGRVVISSCMYREEMKPKTEFSLPSKVRLLFVGYLRPEKGVLDLLDAFEDLRAVQPATLTLAGGSDRKTSAGKLIDERISKSRFATDIEAVGMVEFGEPLFSLYRSHDILIQPSLSEGTPRTLVEARAVGLPVIATKVGGIPSSVSHEVDGLLVPPENPPAIKDAVTRLMHDDILRKTLINNGLNNRDSYSLEGFADSLIEEIVIAHNEARV